MLYKSAIKLAKRRIHTLTTTKDEETFTDYWDLTMYSLYNCFETIIRAAESENHTGFASIIKNDVKERNGVLYFFRQGRNSIAHFNTAQQLSTFLKIGLAFSKEDKDMTVDVNIGDNGAITINYDSQILKESDVIGLAYGGKSILPVTYRVFDRSGKVTEIENPTMHLGKKITTHDATSPQLLAKIAYDYYFDKANKLDRLLKLASHNNR